MLDYLRKSFGFVSVKEEGDMVTVNGVPGLEIMSDFSKHWKNNKLTDYMFTHMGRNSIRFHSFYLPDILYAIETIVSTGKKKYTSIRSLSLMKDALISETRFKTILENEEELLPDFNKLKELKLQPLEYQYTFLKTYFINKYKYNLNGFLLAAAPGGGKTYSALATHHLTGKKQAIIICPLNAIEEVWVKHIKEKVFKTNKTYSTSLDPKIDYNAEFIIVHYEYLKELIKVKLHFNPKETTIILDESHNFNELDSNRTEYYLDICNTINSKDIIHLSGTPIKALPVEAIPLFRAIDPLFSKDVQDGFKKIYRQNNNRATDILSNRLGLVSFKVQKEEIGLDKPDISNILIKIPNSKDYTLEAIKIKMKEFIEERTLYYKNRHEEDKELFFKGLVMYKKSLSLMSRTQIREYESYLLDVTNLIDSQGAGIPKEVFNKCSKFELGTVYKFLVSIDKDFANQWKEIRANVKYVHLRIRGECLGRVVGGMRIKCHVDMVNHIDFRRVCESTEKKTVVFTSYTEVLEKCMDLFPRIQLKGAFVYAKTNKNLNSIIRDFEQNEMTNPLVTTFKSLSTAVPLVMADTMIIIDTPFRDYVLQQTISRINRLDATTKSTVFICVLDTGEEKNISGRSQDILEWSQKQIQQIIGITSPYMIEDINTLDGGELSLEGYLENLDLDKDLDFDEIPKFVGW